MSLQLRCTVRGCQAPLAVTGEALRCSGGHSFDRARDGYWSLLQPQDRRSESPGDRDAAVDARRGWLARGFAAGLVATLREAVDALRLPPGSAAVDVGCGEGTFTAGVLGGRNLAVCGVDLAVRAVRLAARRTPSFTWVVANADRGLPLADRSVALALSIFGRRPVAELARVLAPGGAVVVAVPGATDLIELRAAASGAPVERDRVAGVFEEFAPAFVLAHRHAWRSVAEHDRGAIEDALAMSYRGARDAERARRAGVGAIEVTLAAEILVFHRGLG